MVELSNRTGVVIESLESRALLSASPAGHLHAAAPSKVKLTIPNILGSSYEGTLTTSAGIVFNTTFTVLRETKTGAIHGTFNLTNATSGSGGYNVTGTVSLKRKVAFHGRSHNVSLTAAATLSADSSTVIGTFKASGNHQTAHGPFSLTRVTAVPV